MLSNIIGRIIASLGDCLMRSQRRSAVFFAVCVVLFLLHQYIQKVRLVSTPFLDSYLDPLLFMPILLTLINYERRVFTKNPTYSLPLYHIVGYLFLVSFSCEVLFPLWNDRMIADIWDVLFYALGTILYIVVESPTLSKGNKNT